MGKVHFPTLWSLTRSVVTIEYYIGPKWLLCWPTIGASKGFSEGKRYVQTGVFLGRGKTVNQGWLVGQCGRKNKNHQIKNTYLSSAKVKDSPHTNYFSQKFVFQKSSNFSPSFFIWKFAILATKCGLKLATKYLESITSENTWY